VIVNQLDGCWHDAIIEGVPILVQNTPDDIGNPDVDLQIQLAEQFGYRVAWIYAISPNFAGCNLHSYNYLVAYKGANFNIAPPQMNETLTSVYDAIGELRDRPIAENDGEFDSHLPLNWAELELITNMPNGWSTESMYHYFGNRLPPREYVRDFRRITWSVGSVHCDTTIPIHPIENRALTNGEWQWLLCDTSNEWVQRQIDLFLLDHWKQQDWQSRYCGQVRNWLGKNVPGIFCKEFDITEYKPMFHKAYCDSLRLHNYIGWWKGKLHDTF